MQRDGLAARLLQTFLDELDDQLVALERDLLLLERNGLGDADTAERLGRIFRIAHSLKGAARVANVPAIESVCHALESRLAEARSAARPPSEQELALLLASVDALADAGRRLRAGEPADAEALGTLGALERRLGAGAPMPAPELPSPSGAVSEVPGAASPPAAAHPAAPALAGGGTAAPPVRVESSKLDDLLHAGGQLAVTVANAGGLPASLEALATEAERALVRWRRRAPGLRQALARESAGADGKQLAWQVVDQLEGQLRRMASELGRLSAVARGDARALHRASALVMDELQRVRLRPFAEAVEGLPRTVRDVSAASGRSVALELSGTAIEADRAVIDALREALLHLVRNAVDHGIEPRHERTALGKPPDGAIRVAAVLHGADLEVTVQDDGRGLDTAAVRQQLAARGLPVPESEDELAQVLFLGGFSTRREATAISGRGVGLDAVRNAVQRVRGSVRVSWTRGVGTSFVIQTPLRLATQRMLVVAVGGQRMAISSGAVARLARVDMARVHDAGGQRLLTVDSTPVPFASLAALLGPPVVARPPEGRRPVVVLEAGGRRVAVAVDRLMEETELVVRPIERRGAGPLPLLAGASILGDGQVALVLNAAALVAAGSGRDTGPAPEADAGPDATGVAGPAAGRPTVLVVDDSLTTRTLERSVLEAAGYEVVTAVDGEDAWRLLQERGADLVLTDVEMPRMDGIALCEAIRGSKRFSQLPVIVVTSLESPDHRARGLEAGADAYVVKSGFDQSALLATVGELLVRERA